MILTTTSSFYIIYNYIYSLFFFCVTPCSAVRAHVEKSHFQPATHHYWAFMSCMLAKNSYTCTVDKHHFSISIVLSSFRQALNDKNLLLYYGTNMQVYIEHLFT